MASRRDDGIDVLVEIHTDALSRDSGGRLDWSTVSRELQPFAVEGVTGHALGHVDMLRHLCHHTLEPVAWIKLIALADIYGYGSTFDADIPWQQLADQHPFVINTLNFLGCMASPPESLRQHLPPTPVPCPADVGRGYPPLSITLGADLSYARKVRQLMVAPDWWLHCFYNVPPHNSLLMTRTLRHPANVLRWVTRRFLTSIRDRAS